MTESAAEVNIRKENDEAKELNQKKVSHMARLRQTSALKGAGGRPHDDALAVEATNNTKHAFAAISKYAAQLEDLQAQVKSQGLRADRVAEQFRGVDHRLENIEKRMEEKWEIQSSLMQKSFDEVKETLVIESRGRATEMKRLEDLVNGKDQKYDKAIRNSIDEESNARMLLANDCSKLADHIVEVKKGLAEDIAALYKQIQMVHQKCHKDLIETKEVISAEATSRERFLASVKNDFTVQLVEVRQHFDAQQTEMRKDVRGDLNQLTFLLDQLRLDFISEIEQSNRKTETKFAEVCQRNSLDEAELQRKTADLVGTIENVMKSIEVKFFAFDGKLFTESQERRNDVSKIFEAMAHEHLQREQDESAMIALMEELLKQGL